MWFARPSLAVILLVSPTLFAQHTASAASASHTSSSSSSVSHTSAPTSASHSTPASAPMHTSSPSPAPASHTAPTTTAVKAEPKEPAPKESAPKESAPKESLAKRVLPPGETAEAEKAERKENPELRRPVLCGGKPCRIIDGDDQAELRKHICLKEPCASPCPGGAAPGKGGCVVAPPTPSTAHMPQACPVGQVWNGAVCVPTGVHCQPGQISNGATCQADCATVSGQSGNLTLELRSARQERDRACRQDPGSIQCQQAEMSYSSALLRYQGFLTGVPAQCRAGLPDPISI
jgi:hypothetical protein